MSDRASETMSRMKSCNLFPVLDSSTDWEQDDRQRKHKPLSTLLHGATTEESSTH